MRRLLVLAIASLAACATAPAPAETSGLFAGLDNQCWRATLDAAGTTDTHCFSTAVGGKLSMDVHKVRDAKGVVVYAGVTVYRPAADGWVFEYSNSLGDLITGRAARAGAELHFWSAGVSGAPDTIWRLSADAYAVTGKAGEADRTFRRTGEAAGGL